MRRLLGVMVVVSWAGSASAAGNEFKWCVDSSGSATDFFCTSPTACDNPVPFSSIADALAAAAAAPDVSPGVRPAFQEICVATPGVHSESVVMDNSTGALGSTVALNFVNELAPTWCSPTGGGIGFTGFGGSSGFISRNLWWDEAVCGINDGTPLLAVADAGTSLFNVRAIGGSGTFLAQTGTSTFGNLIEKVRVEGRAGTAIDTADQASITETELSSNTPPSGESLVVSGAALENSIYQSLFFGNVISGGGSLMQLPGGGESRSNVYAGNIVLDSAPLVAIGRPPIGESDRMSFRSDVFSRNRLLAAGATGSAAPIEVGRSPDPGYLFNFCLAEGADNLYPIDRQLPSSTGGPSSAALIEFDGGGSVSPFVVDVEGCFVVDNELGAGGSVLRGVGPGIALGLVLIHNTIAAGGGAVLEHSGSGGAWASLARNLFVDPPALGSADGLASVEATMDQGPGVQQFYGSLSSVGGIVGPAPVPLDWTAAGAFRTPSSVASLNECQRAQAVCPELLCPPQIPTPREWFCALDSAANYLPGEANWPPAALEWPWATDFFDPAPAGDQYNVPGASGWFCEEREVPFDALDSTTGDGDGFSNLVDCDNESSTVLPSIPGADGYGSDECWDVEEDCYECPSGSTLVDPPGDDDDATADDDDSSATDDDDSTTPDDDDDSAELGDDADEAGNQCPTIRPGCQRGIGCGVPLGGAWLPLVLFIGFRRRRTELGLPLVLPLAGSRDLGS